MRKIFIIALSLTALVGFNACQKDGVYNPKEKISRIFHESNYTDGKELDETWTWDDNLLTKITQAGDGFYNFTYDGKVLTQVNSSSGSRMNLIYDGNKIQRMECYSNNELVEDYSFEHDGSKISKITVTSYSDDYKKSDYLRFVLGNYADNKLIDRIEKCKEAKAGKANSFSYTMTFEWKGDNVNVFKIDYSIIGYTATTTYEYDNKCNPFYRSIFETFANGAYCQSKNNITKATYSDSEGEYELSTYSYVYDGKFPTEKRYYAEDSDNYSIYYYEYE